MPFYDFQCDTCGDVFEERLAIAERNNAVACRSCGEPAHRKMCLPARPNRCAHSGDSEGTAQLPNNATPDEVPAAVNLNSGGAVFKNCRIENAPIGIRAPGDARLNVVDCEFKRVGVPIMYRDSKSGA